MDFMNNRAFKAFGSVAAVVIALHSNGCASTSNDVGTGSSHDRSQPQSFSIVEGRMGIMFNSDGRTIKAQAVRNNGEHWEPIRRLKREYNCHGEDYRKELARDVASAAPFSSKARDIAEILAKQNLPPPRTICGG